MTCRSEVRGHPPHLLLGEEVFDQTAHDLLGGPGGADVRGDQTPQNPLRVPDPSCTRTDPELNLSVVEGGLISAGGGAWAYLDRRR